MNTMVTINKGEPLVAKKLGLSDGSRAITANGKGLSLIFLSVAEAEAFGTSLIAAAQECYDVKVPV